VNGGAGPGLGCKKGKGIEFAVGNGAVFPLGGTHIPAGGGVIPEVTTTTGGASRVEVVEVVEGDG